LNWNSDLTPCHGTVSVYENVYRRLSGQASWQLWATTPPHNITGQSSADQQSVEIATGVSCEAYDYKVELFRTGETTPEYVRDPSNDPDLAGRSEEALQRPLLSILRVPQENVVLSWPSNFAGFRLECITDLRTQSWVTCLPAATLVGTEWMVTNRLDTNRYYRLAQP